MILLLIAIILTIVMVCLYNWKLRRIQNNIETFENQIENLIPEKERKIYFFVIESYRSILDRYPTATELSEGFGRLNNNIENEKEFVDNLMSTQEYSDKILNDSPEEQLENKLRGVMQIIAPDNSILTPTTKVTLLTKYSELGQNFDLFKEYIEGTQDFKHYLESIDSTSIPGETETSDSDTPGGETVQGSDTPGGETVQGSDTPGGETVQGSGTPGGETVQGSDTNSSPEKPMSASERYIRMNNILNDILKRPNINQNRVLVPDPDTNGSSVNEGGETSTRTQKAQQAQRRSTTNRDGTYVNEEGETLTRSQLNTNTIQPARPELDSINNETVVVVVDGKKFHLPRPDINKHTQVDSSSHNATKKRKPTDKLDCSVLDKISENTTLAELHSKREMEDLKYHCEMRNNYDNVNDDLTLIKGQEWSVPQIRTPVCYSQSCHVANQFDQTSLIGTLIDDVDKNKYIMPEFSYTEEM